MICPQTIVAAHNRVHVLKATPDSQIQSDRAFRVRIMKPPEKSLAKSYIQST